MAKVLAEPDTIELTARIVSAYVGHNPVSTQQLSQLIGEIHAALRSLESVPTPASEEKPLPAIAIKKSVTPDFLICLEDGKKFKSLKRHLATHYDLSPEQYRSKWGLPADYPMVAPSYSATRSQMARALGLGRNLNRRQSPSHRRPGLPARSSV